MLKVVPPIVHFIAPFLDLQRLFTVIYSSQ
nr:MAG TPA: hypothetical protein [Caudoviricetes sp.]DAO97892.1 MAG TPA: hypothetical protein [Caudoviricetes sp.]